jgi:Carboxypeptidase regulatory-like domain
MTLSIKPQYKTTKKLVEKERHHPYLNTTALILPILLSCLGAITLTVIFAMYGSMIFTSPIPIPAIDLGSVNGFVTGSDALPISGASVHVYKHMALPDSVDKNVGYSTSIRTESDGSYSLRGLPSGVYKFTVTYPDGLVQKIDNYAVSPSSSSSYIFRK